MPKIVKLGAFFFCNGVYTYNVSITIATTRNELNQKF